MPSATFSLFPSVKESSQEHKALQVRHLVPGQLGASDHGPGLLGELPFEAKDEPISAAGPAPSQPSTYTQRSSTTSKSSSSSSNNSLYRQPTPSAPSLSSERPLSPEGQPLPSMRSTSPTLVASNRTSITSTLKPRKKAAPAEISVNRSAPIRSIFPTYDPDRQLQDQYYLPTQASPTNLAWEQVCKMPYSPDFFPSQGSGENAESAGLLFTPPMRADSSLYTPEIELPALWELSNGRANAVARTQTYHLEMHRTAALSEKQSKKNKKRKCGNIHPLLTFGHSQTNPFLSVLSEKCKEESDSVPGQTGRRVRIRKHNLTRFNPRRDHYTDASILVSDMTLEPNAQAGPSTTGSMPSPDRSASDIKIATITPHKAILDSLSMAGSSSTATELAVVDPGASSIAAANLAESAMNAARQAHTCDLVFTSIAGMRQRGYAMKHPSLGVFRIQTTGDIRLHNEPAPEAAPTSPGEKPIKKPGIVKILAPVHEKQLYDYNVENGGNNRRHTLKPMAPPLASIDLETSTLSLHGAEITDLSNKYILDTVVSALIAVIIAETSTPRVSHLTSFEAPPTKAITDVALMNGGRNKFFPLIKSKKPKKPSLRDKTAADVEDSLSVAFGAMVFVLGAAVDGLAGWTEKTKDVNEQK